MIAGASALWDSARARLGGTPLVLMLDVDGTLAPIAPSPDAAAVPVDTHAVLMRLSARVNTRLVVVSGRGASDARRMVGVPGAWVLGNHGTERIASSGEHTVDQRAAAYTAAISAAATQLADTLAAERGVLVENKTLGSSVHYRLAEAASIPRVREAVLAAAASHGLRVTEGKCLFELRPPIDIDKGSAVLALAAELGALSPGASLLYAGDDVTDEDAFRALREYASHAVTICVSDTAAVCTAAEFVLHDPAALRDFLVRLADEERSP